MDFLYLNDDDIRSLEISIVDVAEEVKSALVSLASGNAEMPSKLGVAPIEGSLIHAMPVFLRGKDVCGVKWVSSYPQNAAKGLPRVVGFQILNDPHTGLPLCLMDCRRITLYRTAALSVLFAQYCISDSPKIMAVLGAGAQAATHVKAFKETFPAIYKVIAYDINSNVAENFIKNVQKLGIEGEVAKCPKDTTKGADVILSAGVMTPSVHIHDMKNGCIGIGLDMGKVWHADVIEGAGIITDSEFQLKRRFEKEPDSFQLSPNVRAELGEIILNKANGRLNHDERLIFVSTGIAANDLAVADLVYKKALMHGIGVRLQM